jgi:hypothetical protein
MSAVGPPTRVSVISEAVMVRVLFNLQQDHIINRSPTGDSQTFLNG